MGITNHDKEHIEAIIAGSYGDWFTAKLLRVIKHADFENRARLRLGFPDEVDAVYRYEQGKPQKMEELG